MSKVRHRVFTYITRGNDLLLFDHVDNRYLKPQIPGGTIEPGETPDIAAVREAKEETGLSNLALVACLGDFEVNLSDLGRNETIHAWFYHLLTKETTPTKWRHFEEHSSESSEPIEFELYWVAIDKLPELGGLDGTMLQKIQDSLSQ